MGAFGGLQLTNKGIALQAKAQAGAELHYTRVAIGDGFLGGQSIATLTDLISEKKSLDITKLKVIGSGKALIGAVLTNQDIVTGFYFREIGIFADDPDEGEILYAYANAGNNAEYIPPGGGPDVVEKHIDSVVVVGQAPNVTAVIDQSLVFATLQDFDEHKSAAVLDHPDGSVTTAKLADGAVTSGKLAAGAATDTVIGTRTINDASAPNSDTGSPTNLWSWLAYMIKAITGKSNWRTAPATTLEAAKSHMDATTGIHGATSAATANRLAIRDANGNLSVGNASADTHALNRVTADGRYIGRRVMTLTAGTYNDLDVSIYDVVDCQTDGGDIVINNITLPSSYGNRVRFVKTRSANNLIFKYNPDKGVYTNGQKDLVLSSVDRYGIIEAQIFANVCYASIMTWNADQLGGIPAERFIFGDNARGSITYQGGDLNDVTKTSFYHTSTTTLNHPPNVSSGFLLHVNHPNNNEHAIQMFQAGADRWFLRRKQDGTWLNWLRLWHEGDIPYETGSWTPDLRFGGQNTGITYATRAGRYTRIGNVVYWAVHIALTSKGTATGAATIAGLPFAAINSAPNATSAVGLVENITLPAGADWACGVIFNNFTEITLRASGNISNINLTDVNFSNNSGIRMEGHYYI